MQHTPTTFSATDEAEYYSQELRAQRLRAKQLFRCYLGEEDAENVEDDDVFFDDDAR
jgi:hypothetical protein